MVDLVPRTKLKRANHESSPACCDRSHVRRHFQRPHAVRRCAYRDAAQGDRIGTRFVDSVVIGSGLSPAIGRPSAAAPSTAALEPACAPGWVEGWSCEMENAVLGTNAETNVPGG